MFGIPAVELIGFAAGFFTAFSTVPQSLKIIRTQKSGDVSSGTYGMLLISYILWLVYGLVQGALSIIFWNIIGVVLGLTILVLKLFVWK